MTSFVGWGRFGERREAAAEGTNIHWAPTVYRAVNLHRRGDRGREPLLRRSKPAGGKGSLVCILGEPRPPGTELEVTLLAAAPGGRSRLERDREAAGERGSPRTTLPGRAGSRQCPTWLWGRASRTPSPPPLPLPLPLPPPSPSLQPRSGSGGGDGEGAGSQVPAVVRLGTT